MTAKWVTVAPGIRAREHPTRKHGVRPDRYFTLRFSVDRRQVEEKLGWESEGWTVKRAQEQLGKLREAHHTGKGAATLRERRRLEREAERQAREAAERRQRLEKTVTDLWERYAREVIAVENKPRTAAEKARLWARRIKPALGHLKICDVIEEDVGAVVRAPLRLDASGQAVGGKAEAGNVYRLLHHLFRKALAWGMRSRELGNPLETVTEPKTARRERLLAPGEVGALLKALAAAEETKTEAPQIVAVIRAAILTGARISELLSLRWEDIRRDEMELHLPDTKTGFSRRPLSMDTLTVLEGMERAPGIPFVFRAIKSTAEPLAYNTVEKAFRRIVEAAGVKSCTLHTIRHWYATATANTVSNPRIGMALTGHKSHSAYMNYLHGDKEQARALADRLAKLATELGAAEPNVVNLPKAVNS
jgi:integrase